MPLRRNRRPLSLRQPVPHAAAEPLEGRTLFAFPSIRDVSLPTSVYEGRTVTVSGRFTDADLQPETHTVRFEWGDGTPDTVQPLPAGFLNFNASHVYADDLPGVSGDADRREIRITVTDALGATSSTTRSLRLINLEPQVTLPNFLRALEGAALTIDPEVYEPGTDALTYQWWVRRDSGSGPLVFESAERNLVFTPPDDGTYHATLLVTDDDGGWNNAGTTIAATNAAPTLSVSGVASADEGAPYVLNLSSSDVGADTISRWTIEWGDGQVQTVEGNPPTVAHAYDGPGHYTIRATATDEDGRYGAPLLGVAHAAGDLDTSFGAGGRAMTDFPRANDVLPRDAAAYPDGRVLFLIAHEGAYTHNHTSLARFNPDGSFDGSFSSDGRVYEPDAMTTDGTLLLQADGRIVVAGVNYTHVVARRYHPDGSRDATFGAGGEVKLSFPPGTTNVLDAAVHDVLALPGGRVLLAGRLGPNATAIVLNADGSPDASFGGGDGVYDVPLPPATRATGFFAAALAADGRIALTGNLFDSDFRHSIYTAVLRPDGTPDPAFSGDGFVTTTLSHPNLTGGDGEAFAAAFQPDGKLLVGGDSIYQSWPLLRYRTDGTLDPTFGGDGIAQNAWPAGDRARLRSLTVLPDGRIVSVGHGNTYITTGDVGMAITRHNPDGTLDGTFGTGGRVVWGAADTAVAALPAAGGKLVIAGQMQDRVMLARFNADGSTDTAFGDNGAVMEDRFASDEGGIGLVLLKLPDNKLLAVHQPNVHSNDLRLARFHADGSIDTTFGDFGRVAISANGYVRTVTLAPGGRIVVAGPAGVTRYNADGSPDTTFGANGAVNAPLGTMDDLGGNLVQVGEVVVDAAGRVVIAGSARDQLRVARLNPDGSPDASFGQAGLFKGYADMWSVSAVALEPGGKVLVGTGGLVRLTADGAPDPSFGGGDGLAAVPQPSDPSPDPLAGLSILKDLLVLPDGRILAVGGGNTEGGSAGGFEIAAFLPDGLPDPSFGGGDGRVTAPVPGMPQFPNGAALQIAVDPRGRILVDGFGKDSGSPDLPRYAVMRFSPDGAQDYAFGRDGVASVFTSATGSFEAVAGMVVLDDGDVLIGGSENDTIYGRLLVSRFHADAAAELTVDVRNLPPAATAGPDYAVTPNSPLTLTGSFTDAGGDTHTFRWVVTAPGGGVVAEGTEPSLTFTPAAAGRYTATFTVTDDDGASATDTASIEVAAAVVGRHVFYNDSAFDGRDAGANEADDAAIAPDKQALGHDNTVAGFAHVTSYARGLNGVMIDVAGLPHGDEPLSAEDFVFAARPAGSTGWTAGPSPAAVTVRRGAGAGGSDRITLTWPAAAARAVPAAARAVANGWLEITLKPTARTGLARADFFSFGNLVGDSGDAPNTLPAVDAQDLADTRRALARTAPLTSPHDHDRDGRVNAVDLWLTRSNQGQSLPGIGALPTAAASQPPARRRPPTRGLLDPARPILI